MQIHDFSFLLLAGLFRGLTLSSVLGLHRGMSDRGLLGTDQAVGEVFTAITGK